MRRKEQDVNRMDFSGRGAAEVVYGDGEFHIVRHGEYVTCAVTGTKIPLDELRYWSVDRQEAYASPEISLRRYQEVAGQK